MSFNSLLRQKDITGIQNISISKPSIIQKNRILILQILVACLPSWSLAWGGLFKTGFKTWLGYICTWKIKLLLIQTRIDNSHYRLTLKLGKEIHVRYCVIFYNVYFVNTWNTNETSVEFSYGSVFVIKFVLFIF